MFVVTFMGIKPIIWIVPWTYFMVKGDKRDRKIGMLLLILVVLTDALCSHALKPLIGRERPFTALPNIRLLMETTQTVSRYSFPSNHAANAFAVATFLTLVYRKRGVALFFFAAALLVAYSRVYVGVHYPSDVLGGALIGCALAAGLYFGVKRWI